MLADHLFAHVGVVVYASVGLQVFTLEDPVF